MKSLRALVVADQESKFIWDHFDRSRFEGIDVIVSCGDLKASYLSFLTTMVAAPLLYVPGNHDSAYLRDPPEGCEDLTQRMVTIKGVRFIGFGGANSAAPKAFHYTEKDVSKQIVRRIPEICSNGGFDVLVTHAPAHGVGDGDGNFHKGFRGYLALLHQYQPCYHLHGHQHASYPGYKQNILYRGTQVINGYGYRILDMNIRPRPEGEKRLSYIKTRYHWGRAYAGLD